MLLFDCFYLQTTSKKVVSGVVVVLAKCCLEAHLFLHKRNRLEVKVRCGNTDKLEAAELQKDCSFVSGLVENISCFLS